MSDNEGFEHVGSGAGVMDPKPGQKYVEYHKDGGDGNSKGGGSGTSGLDVEIKPKHGPDRIYISKVKHPAPEYINVGDRLIALNGKSMKTFDGDLDQIRHELGNNNVIRMVIDQTLLKD